MLEIIPKGKKMKFSLYSESKSEKVIEFFKKVFSESEGEAEGQVIADFVTKLIETTQPQDLVGCLAEEQQAIVGGIFFSRLTVTSGQQAFMLSPVAVSTEVQRTGIGQMLIQYGLNHLKSMDVSFVFTYGDPNYYLKTGFQRINENNVKAPCPLSQPIGWLAQSLDGQDIRAMAGNTRCVEALNDPSLW